MSQVNPQVQNQQDLISQVYELLMQNERLNEWRIRKSRNTIELQYISPYIEDNTDIYVDFHGQFVEITVLEAYDDGDDDGEPLTTITRIFNDGIVEFEKELPAKGYRVTIEIPEWKKPADIANAIADIIDTIAHL